MKRSIDRTLNTLNTIPIDTQGVPALGRQKLAKVENPLGIGDIVSAVAIGALSTPGSGRADASDGSGSSSPRPGFGGSENLVMVIGFFFSNFSAFGLCTSLVWSLRRFAYSLLIAREHTPL